jgi:hypothetical protein
MRSVAKSHGWCRGSGFALARPGAPGRDPQPETCNSEPIQLGGAVAEDWDQEHEASVERARRIVSSLLVLARDDEARRLLGVDGTLEDELDLTFLDDPVEWIASEIATAIQLQDDESQGVSLSSVVALLRLYRVLRGGSLDEQELQEAVRAALIEGDDEGDDDR